MSNRLSYLLLVTSILSVSPLSLAQAASLSLKSLPVESAPEVNRLKQIAQDAPTEASIVEIVNVRIEPTETGLAIVIETAGGELSLSASDIVGNASVIEIDNAVLALPGDETSFERTDLSAEIASVRAIALPDGRVQVTVTGTDAPPAIETLVTETGLTLAVVPGVAQADEETEEETVEIVVTGEVEDDGYALPPMPDVTRLDVPIENLPRSVQIVPSEVIEDQGATRIREALQNVSGVVQDGGFAGTADQFNIRGFFLGDIFRDGFRDPSNIFELSNVERVEILKGPASILFGNIQPGGAINIVTERPLFDPYYAADIEIGSFSHLRPTVDLSGPLTENGAVRYRLNAAFQASDGFRDFDRNLERYFISPVFALDLGENTELTLDFSYTYDERPFDRGFVASGDGVIDVPITRFFGEPDDFRESEQISGGYRLEHEFGDNWSARSAFRVVTVDDIDFRAEPLSLDEETGLLSRNFRSNDDLAESYTLQNEIQGQFSTGPLDHRLVVGIDLSRQTSGGTQRRLPPDLTPDLNVFDPEYEQVARPDFDDLTVEVRNNQNRTDSLGLYIQDFVEVTDDLQVLLGGRFDFVEQVNRNFRFDTRSEQDVDAFSPTVGVLYRPTESLAFYANYARSFQPNFGTAVDGSFLDPERGTQYEIGARGEFFDGGLTANLALYHIVLNNLATPDPDNPDFTIPAGEQRSQGIELDLIGRILPGWNVIASYSYIDAEITEAVFGVEEGGRIGNVPEHSASLWTTYEIQDGDLEGLGFGLGLFYMGERAGNFFDTFELPSYLRTDAAVFYRRENWRAAVNVQNLFDIDYFVANNFGRVAIEPGAPLTVVGSISVEF